MPNLLYGSVLNDGVKIQYYRTGGEKPPIVLLHGLSDNGLCWGRLAYAMEPEFDVVMIDARGHGLSGAPQSGYGVENHVADVARVIQETGIKKPVLIGHSMGAATAAELAQTYPQLVSGLVLVDPPWFDLSEAELNEISLRLSDENKNQWNRQRILPLQGLIDEGKQLHPTWNSDDLFQWAKARHQVRQVAADYLMKGHNAWRSDAQKISIPTLIVFGEEELGGQVTSQVAEEARKLMQSGYTVKIPEAGHQIYRDQFELFWEAVQMFLINHSWTGRKAIRKLRLWPFSR